MRSPARLLNRIALTLLLALQPACGLETLCTTTGFTPTPRPRVVIRGELGDLPEQLTRRIGGAALTLRALSVDGAEVARGVAKLGAPFELKLAEGQGYFNLRLVAQAGSTALKTLLPEAKAGDTIEVGTLGATVTAHAILGERSAELERGALASLPPQVLGKVLTNAANSTDGDVVAFRAMVRAILDATAPSGEGAPALQPDGSNASDDGLAQAGVPRADYEILRDRAAQAVSVPVVCDPSRVRALFTVDVSGQALDGNGALQFMRQAPKAGSVVRGLTVGPLYPVADVEGTLKRRLTPNDTATQMYDDGTHGDEVAGDKVFSLTLDLPRAMRVIYKYTDGSAGEGFTGTEEWPGNARILQLDDLLTGVASGAADCIVVRRDSFGDEATNKNFVNLNVQVGGGALGYDVDLGGLELPAPTSATAPRVGGLKVSDLRSLPPLTPTGIAEARENGICGPCPAPLTVATDDREPPRLIAAAFTATDRVRVTFSEDVDLASAAAAAHYQLFDDQQLPLLIHAVKVRGASVILETATASPDRTYYLAVQGVADASADKNVIAAAEAMEVGPDRTAPQLSGAEASGITEVNPAARPADPSTGQVVVVGFDEVLDQVSAEDVANYQIVDGEGRALAVQAAYQRGRQVLLVTATQSRAGAYLLTVSGMFDVAGNLVAASSAPFTGFALYRVGFSAVAGFAFLSADGRQRGLPAGEQLYLTGTALLAARALDGADLRVSGRTDVAGLAGYAFTASDERVHGQPVLRLELFLPAGAYSWKLAHGSASSALDPPATLEGVTKNLATTADNTGVAVDPVTLLGRDGNSYSAARLSLDGSDTPGPTVLFKRENPDAQLVVGNAALDLPTVVVGGWRDVPYGSSHDYDDGLVEQELFVVDAVDGMGPKLVETDALCSAGVLLSFDERVASATSDVSVSVSATDGASVNARVQYVGAPLRTTQIFVQTQTLFPGASYSLSVNGVRDTAGNDRGAQLASFVAPGIDTPCNVVDQQPPSLVEVMATRPDRVRVRFSEPIHSRSAVVANFSLVHRAGGTAPTITAAQLGRGGTEVRLTTSAQEIQAPYTLVARAIDDVAQPPNQLSEGRLDCAGFGDHVPPTFVARAVDPTTVWVKFDKSLAADGASTAANYSVAGLVVAGAQFSGSATLRSASTSPSVAPVAEDQVLLTVSAQSAGQSYILTISGVTDLSGNATSSAATFTGLGAAPNVEVTLEVLVSRAATVFGAGPGGSSGVPGRALSPARLGTEREGIFVRGAGLSADGVDQLAASPVTLALQGFPALGAAGLAQFVGPDPQLFDDATHGDRVAGDGLFTLVIAGVPLGTTLAWKDFAPYSVAYRDSSGDAAAAMADADPGPSQYDDGEEYPGNDNGARLVADSDGDGRIVLRHLFGDEVTFKRKALNPPFAWVNDVFERTP